MEQHLAVAVGIVVLDVPLRVLGDVGAHQPHLVPTHVREGALQARPALAERFDLRSHQHESALEALEQLIVVARAPILRDELGPAGHVTDWTKKTRRAGCRFRPPLRRTFGFRLEPTGEASSYSRPVLGAGGTLRGMACSRKPLTEVICAKSDLFFRRSSTGRARPSPRGAGSPPPGRRFHRR